MQYPSNAPETTRACATENAFLEREMCTMKRKCVGARVSHYYSNHTEFELIVHLCTINSARLMHDNASFY